MCIFEKLIKATLTHIKLSIKTSLDVDVILYSRRSKICPRPFPHGIGINKLGQASNFASHELFVKSGADKHVYKYSSSSPPFMFKMSKDMNKVVPEMTMTKNMMAIKAHMNWLRMEEGTSVLMYITNDDPHFDILSPMITEVLIKQKLDRIQIWHYDQINSEKQDMITRFEKTDVFKKMEEIVTTQGSTKLGVKGCDDLHKEQKGKIHFTVASFFRVPFFAHSALVFVLIRRLERFTNFNSEAFPMSTLNKFIGDHLYELFSTYDRGRHNRLENSASGMIGELRIPFIPEDLNYDQNQGMTICDMVDELTDSKYERLLEYIPNECNIPTKLKICILSWNVAGYTPENLEVLKPLFHPLKKNDLPDIIIIGLQEVVELKARDVALNLTNNLTSIFVKTESKVDEWFPRLNRILKRLGNYVCKKGRAMFGLLSLVYIRDEVRGAIWDIEASDVKTGMLGLMGNKGSVITSFKIFDASFHFANTHLPSGGTSCSKRADCIQDLYRQKVEVEDCDIFFIFGDLNLRVQLKLERYKQIMHDFEEHNPEIDWEELRINDEVAVGEQPILSEFFEEPPLPLHPTYRTMKGTSVYTDDRVASWTDRIFYYSKRKNHGVETIESGAIDMMQSDHK